MALFGSNIPSEVGLRLLLCPFGSNVVIRTACCSVGVILPVYSTYKAIEKKDQDEQQKWLVYWAAYGSFSLAEAFADKILYWVPLYYHMKFAFLVWLQLPSVDGARQLYMRHLRPFFLRHQAQLDQTVGFFYGEIAKFINLHQSEFNAGRTIFMKILAGVREMFGFGFGAQENEANRGIEGPTNRTTRQMLGSPTTRQAEDSESDHEE